MRVEQGTIIRGSNRKSSKTFAVFLSLSITGNSLFHGLVLLMCQLLLVATKIEFTQFV